LEKVANRLNTFLLFKKEKNNNCLRYKNSSVLFSICFFIVKRQNSGDWTRPPPIIPYKGEGEGGGRLLGGVGKIRKTLSSKDYRSIKLFIHLEHLKSGRWDLYVRIITILKEKKHSSSAFHDTLKQC
jgi:hypothetical protein